MIVCHIWIGFIFMRLNMNRLKNFMVSVLEGVK